MWGTNFQSHSHLMMHSCLVQNQCLNLTKIEWLAIQNIHCPLMGYCLLLLSSFPGYCWIFMWPSTSDHSRVSFKFRKIIIIAIIALKLWVFSMTSPYVAGISNKFICGGWCNKWSICCWPLSFHSQNAIIHFYCPCYQHWTAYGIRKDFLSHLACSPFLCPQASLCTKWLHYKLNMIWQ